MRIAKTEAAVREAFVTEFFKANPSATALSANEAVKAKFGQMMRAVRVYEIRSKVRGSTIPVPVATSAPEPVAGAAPTTTPDIAAEFK